MCIDPTLHNGPGLQSPPFTFNGCLTVNHQCENTETQTSCLYPWFDTLKKVEKKSDTSASMYSSTPVWLISSVEHKRRHVKEGAGCSSTTMNEDRISQDDLVRSIFQVVHRHIIAFYNFKQTDIYLFFMESSWEFLLNESVLQQRSHNSDRFNSMEISF